MSVYDSIITGLNEAVAYSKGACKEAKVQTIRIEPVPAFAPAEIKVIRQDLGMTQNIFASVMGVSAKTVEAWEQGINTPNGPSRRLLSIFKQSPASAKSLVSES